MTHQCHKQQHMVSVPLSVKVQATEPPGDMGRGSLTPLIRAEGSGMGQSLAGCMGVPASIHLYLPTFIPHPSSLTL